MAISSISIGDFEKLIVTHEWQRKYDYGVLSDFERTIELMGVEQVTRHYNGWASVTSVVDDIEIIYTEHFEFDVCLPSSISTNIDGGYDFLSIQGVVVLDDSGQKMHPYALDGLLNPDFSKIDYSKIVDQIISGRQCVARVVTSGD